MFDRTRVKYYEKFLGKECVREFVGFEAFCAPKRAPKYLVDSTLEWVLTLPPELRIEGIRIARAILELPDKREEAIKAISLRVHLELWIGEAEQRLKHFEGEVRERAELARQLRAARAEHRKLDRRAEALKLPATELAKAIQEFTARHGVPFNFP
ncbi:MAG TPA: hypothetical protein VKT78_15995 [Fimbriimonadaceae bacterium]|nr:hypothetical protein [Fimbriimonadaceae bacterium]